MNDDPDKASDKTSGPLSMTTFGAPGFLAILALLSDSGFKPGEIELKN